MPVSSQYSSDQVGLFATIGPVALPNGRTRVTVQTQGFFIADLITVQGTCDTGFGSLFNLMSGQAAGGAQNIINGSGCVALFVTSNVSERWSLSFEPLG